MYLTEQEQKMLNGECGAGTQLAMEVLNQIKTGDQIIFTEDAIIVE